MLSTSESSKSTGSIYQILSDRAKSVPEKVYLYSSKRPVSYAQTCRASARIARYLCDGDRFRGTRILAASFDHTEYLVYLIWACLASGICLAFLPASRDQTHMRSLMKLLGTTRLATDIPELQGISPPIPFERLTKNEHTADEELTGMIDWSSEANADTPAFIFQTSGTMGESKWVQVNHRQFIVAIKCLLQVGGLEHATDQVVYITPPLSHSYGLSSMLEYTLVGSAIVLPPRSSPLGPVGGLLHSALASHITSIEGVPYFYAQMSRLIDRIRLPTLRHIGLGGGRLDLEIINHVRDFYPKLSYTVRYGMTETPSVVSHKLFKYPYEDDWKSSGKVLPIYDLQILGEKGLVSAPYEEGEVWIRGTCLALPYYGEAGNVDDFFATGDIGYFNAAQELCIVGRRSLFLKIRGFRVSLEYIESVVRMFEGVRDCRILQSGCSLVAEVVCSCPLSKQDLLSFLEVRLPDYMRPESVTFVKTIPRTSSGKIRRYWASPGLVDTKNV